MQEGLYTRYVIHEVLKMLKMHSLGFEDALQKKLSNNKYISKSDYKMIQNVVLTSMRYSFYIDKIIKKYSKKIDKSSDSYYLLLSSITQLVILKFDDYAVINSTVELTKNNKIIASTKFINGFLRNINRKKMKLSKINFEFSNLPEWFKKRVLFFNKKQKDKFAKSICNKPDLHLVFKNNKDLKKISSNKIETTNCSIAIKEYQSINKIKGYNDGLWWIQDFASMAPLYLNKKINNLEVLDICAAPGGKTFQLLSYGAKVKAYDNNYKKVEIMKKNLERLNYNCDIEVNDIKNVRLSKKYDLVIIDAPCSSIGTIRRHPEIFFRKKIPDLDIITLEQEIILEKSKYFLKKNGFLIYMVCSFFHEEGEMQVEKFLKKNSNFTLEKFSSTKEKNFLNLLKNNKYYYVIPTKLDSGVLIDGFFAAKLKKND